MKIRDVEIEFIRSGAAKACGPEAVPLKGKNIQEMESRVRGAYARFLAKARQEKRKTVCVLAIEGDAAFPAIASAKILAQEIYRYLGRDGCPASKVRVLCQDQRTWIVFQKVISGYLIHVTRDLGRGPFLTVDTIIEVKGGIVLIKRSNPPFGWALPGGFLDAGESLEAAARREAREETGLVVTNLKQMHTYSDPSRDPRFHTVTTVFVCQAQGRPRADSDAADVCVVTPRQWRQLLLAFDHRQVLEDYLAFRKSGKRNS